MKQSISVGVAGKAVHRNFLSPVFLLVLFTFTCSSTVSAAELVVNGGFEEPVITIDRGWATYYGQNGFDACDPEGGELECENAPLVPGWDVFWTDLLIEPGELKPGRLEIQNNTVSDVPPAKSGEQKAELDTHFRVDSEDNNVTIVQELPTCPRSAYTLSYAWKSRTIIPHDNDLRVSLGDGFVRLHTLNTDWEKEEYRFVSDDSYETVLAFASIGDSTTFGGFLDDVSVIGKSSVNIEDCESEEPEPICELGKPQVLTLLYDGNEFSQYSQNSNEVIITDPPTYVDAEGNELTVPSPNPALIRVYGHNKNDLTPLNSFNVEWGETFDVSGPRNRIPPRLKFEITDPDTGDIWQTVQFHTSCSQPLEALDEFGAITVWGAVFSTEKFKETNKITPFNVGNN